MTYLPVISSIELYKTIINKTHGQKVDILTKMYHNKIMDAINIGKLGVVIKCENGYELSEGSEHIVFSNATKDTIEKIRNYFPGILIELDERTCEISFFWNFL